MLNENIKTLRKSKGLSQEELAIKLNVVRQTVSKWEQGLSVPDSDMLVTISEIFDTPVATLLGETITEEKADALKAISEKLEIVNQQLAQRRESRRKALQTTFIIFVVLVIATLALIGVIGGQYLNWDYKDPESAVMGTIIHGFEWTFVRIAPILLIGGIAGIVLTRKKRK